MDTSRKHAAMLLAAVCSVQFTLPVEAQTTTLQGNVQRASIPLYSQVPQYDNRPVYVVQPTRTVVRTRPARTRTVYLRDNRTFFQRHPKVKAATIGAGVGAAAGAVTGLVSGRGVLRGTAIGAGAGAGVGLIRSSRTLKRHPIIRDVATGTVAGLGLGWAASRRGRTIGKATAIGAAAGLGVGLLRRYF